MIIILVGLLSYNITLFFLINYIFYKKLLFLKASSIIYFLANNQDFRKYNKLKHFFSLIYLIIVIVFLSLVAFYSITRFYSKDFILESIYGQFYFFTIIDYFITIIGILFTT